MRLLADAARAAWRQRALLQGPRRRALQQGPLQEDDGPTQQGPLQEDFVLRPLQFATCLGGL